MKNSPQQLTNQLARIARGCQRPGHADYLTRSQMEQLAIDLGPDLEHLVKRDQVGAVSLMILGDMLKILQILQTNNQITGEDLEAVITMGNRIDDHQARYADLEGIPHP